MTSNTNCHTTTTCTQNCGSNGSGYLVVLVVFILLAIILGSYFIF